MGADAAAANSPQGMGGGGGNLFAQGQTLSRQTVRQELQQATLAERPIDAVASVSAMASSGQLGELFQYAIDSVSLRRQQSAMIPIITDPLKVERLSIFNPAVLANHPLNGARITNTTGKHLLSGPITVLEAGAYAGDANIDNVPPGQNRLISYGVDLDVLVHTTEKPTQTSITSAGIVKGVLHLQHKVIATQEYAADNKGDKQKTLLIEHPLQQNWKLVNTDKPVETTANMYRFQITVDAGKTKMFHVEQESMRGEKIVIGSLDDNVLHYYDTSGEISPPVRDALSKAAKLKAAVVDTQRQIDQHNQQLEQISKEQNRIRENLKTIQQKSDYYNRLLTKLNDQESQIEKLQSQRDDLNAALEKQRSELEQYLENLTVQ
jgi:hypothetical protein